MKRTIFVAALAVCGCSTAPVADVLDWTVPGKSVPPLATGDEEPRIPPPGVSPGPPPGREPFGPGSDAPPLPPPPYEP